jgi:hypothetical protein
MLEIERVWPRRRFEVVFCPGELGEALAPLSARGVKVIAHGPGRASAQALDASIRSMVDAG